MFRRTPLAVTLVLAAGAPLLALAGPAAAVSAAGATAGSTVAQHDSSARAACPRGSGVTVLVDFGATESTRCATGDPRTGLAALKTAGFTVAMVARFPGAVCRINGIPTPATDACVVMPPTTKYWSYWHAQRGGTWTYSTTGAGTYDPKPGTVEGWSYGAGKPPSIPVPK
ncbi:MAG: hypothetical protein U0Q21_01140 [Dermatophilaceae bacterium]